MKNATKKVVCASFDAELESRYREAVKYAAESLVPMQEIPGLHDDLELKGYYHAVADCLMVAFYKPFNEVDSDVISQVAEIIRSDAFISF